MPTRTRLQISGSCLVFITTTVWGWNPVFNNKVIAEATLEQFRGALKHYDANCVAYVLMPTHLHAALGFKEYGLVRKFMQSFKILSSKQLKVLLPTALRGRFDHDGKYSFWMPRYDELVMSSEKQFRVKLDYIHNNPVRGGLVNEPEDWPYSSAGDWLGKPEGPIPIDKHFGYVS